MTTDTHPAEWTASHIRRRHRIIDLLESCRERCDQAQGLSAVGASGLLRRAEADARHAAAQLSELAFTFENEQQAA